MPDGPALGIKKVQGTVLLPVELVGRIPVDEIAANLGGSQMLKRISHHKITNLRSCRVVELIQNDVASVTVFSGHTLLFRFETDDLDMAKQSAIDFLSDDERVRDRFAENHRRFLSQLGEDCFDDVELESRARWPREAHCFACQSDLRSEFHFACSRCGWLVCACGTCGCGYKNYF